MPLLDRDFLARLERLEIVSRRLRRGANRGERRSLMNDVLEWSVLIHFRQSNMKCIFISELSYPSNYENSIGDLKGARIGRIENMKTSFWMTMLL